MTLLRDTVGIGSCINAYGLGIRKTRSGHWTEEQCDEGSGWSGSGIWSSPTYRR